MLFATLTAPSARALPKASGVVFAWLTANSSEYGPSVLRVAWPDSPAQLSLLRGEIRSCSVACVPRVDALVALRAWRSENRHGAQEGG
jgi:hypothetical protein